MLLPSEDSTSISSTLSNSSTEQDVIHQMQSELLALVRLSPDETTENWQTSTRFGDWSSTLENEISRFLW